MAKNLITVNGSIDRYSYSSAYFMYMLKNCDSGPVRVKVNSYGGDVNEALNICNQIAEHGDITVEYISFNASAATLFGLYAKESIINSDSLFLIHKATVWVSNWGTMNDDQIEDAIKEMQKQKKTAEATTLTLAKCFADKSGKPVAEILTMMKEAKWLTAEEAVNAGFVDKVTESKCKKKPAVSNDLAAIFSANGIPLPFAETENEEPEENAIMSALSELTGTLKNIFPKNHKTDFMNKDFQFLNKTVGVDGFEVKNETVAVSLAQLTALNDALKKAEEEKTANATALTSACSERDAAKNDLESVITGLNGLDNTVKDAQDNAAKIAAVKALIESRPGVPANNGEGKDNHPGSGDEFVYDDVNNFFNE
ncbi:MAG: Clp protease ClpP [Tannerellaceae bacterium]|jgi:ATP-dependent protease ClpP protease subunit|nr:Clp protease ClpP [Tannerellaceae bacterium]